MNQEPPSAPSYSIRTVFYTNRRLNSDKIRKSNRRASAYLCLADYICIKAEKKAADLHKHFNPHAVDTSTKPGKQAQQTCTALLHPLFLPVPTDTRIRSTQTCTALLHPLFLPVPADTRIRSTQTCTVLLHPFSFPYPRIPGYEAHKRTRQTCKNLVIPPPPLSGHPKKGTLNMQSPLSVFNLKLYLVKAFTAFSSAPHRAPRSQASRAARTYSSCSSPRPAGQTD